MKEKINIILISGKIGTGKDMATNYITMYYDFYSCSFANELKSLLKECGWNGNKDIKGRKILQDVGQSVRAYDEDFWIKALIKKSIEPHFRFTPITNFIISDLRFKNEVNNIEKYIREYIPYIKEVNIIPIRINGQNFSDRKSSEDISEIDLDDYEHFKYIINNNTTRENVYEQIKYIMKDLGFEKIKVPELC